MSENLPIKITESETEQPGAPVSESAASPSIETAGSTPPTAPKSKPGRKKTSAQSEADTLAEPPVTTAKRKRRKRLTLEEALTATQARQVEQASATGTGTGADSDGTQAEIETVDEALANFASSLGEETGRIRQQTDSMRVLEMMNQGVVANLTIERPRFLTHVRPEDLGLNFSNRKMQDTLKQYFQLGRRSLLPKPLQDRLNAAEAKARACLERYSFRSHWGRFVPSTSYAQWKEENATCEQEFFTLRDEVVEQYKALLRDVVRAYLPVAEDAWRRSQLQDLMAQEVEDSQIETLGVFESEADTEQTQPGSSGTSSRVAAPTPHQPQQVGNEPEVNPEQYRSMLTRFKSEQGKGDFIVSYLRRVRDAMPSVDSIAGRFVYTLDLSYIPLPSLLARDVQKADTIFQERATQNAAFQTEMRKQRAEQEKAEAEVWAARKVEQEKQALATQLERAKTQTELNRLRAQQQMDRDVIEQARIQKEKLVREFFEGIVGEVNQAIFEVCDGAAQSIERNGGKLTGSVAMQLRNLITRLEAMNFSGDMQIEQQLNRLRSVLPPVVVDPITKRTSSAIDNSAVRQLVRELRREAEGVLIDLGHMPVNRRVLREQANHPEQQESALLDTLTSEAQNEAKSNRRRQRVQNEPRVADDAVAQPQPPLNRRRVGVSGVS